MREHSLPFFGYIFQDWQANSGNNKGRVLLFWFRVAQWGTSGSRLTRVVFFPLIVAYKLISQFAFGCDLPLTIRLGLRARIFHVHGLVVNKAAVIGSDVILRNGVTIGVRASGVPGAPTIGNGVEIGSGAMLIGSITVGNGAKIGAGAVVVKNVPENTIAVGNPARLIPGHSVDA